MLHHFNKHQQICARNRALSLTPALQSYISQIVETEELHSANALFTAVMGTCSAVGPLLVAVLTLRPMPGALAWFALSAVMTASVLMQRALPPGSSAATDSKDSMGSKESGVFKQLRDGWRYFIRLRPIVAVVAVSALWHITVWTLFMTEVPTMLSLDYRAVWAWGVLQSVFSVGSIVGSLIALPSAWPLVATCLLSLLPLCVLPLAMVMHAPLWVVFVLCGLGSLSIAASGITWMTAIQRTVAPHRIASVFAYDYMMSEGLAPLGYLVIPPLVAVMGTRPAISGICIGMIGVLMVVSVGSSLSRFRGRS